MVPGLSRWLLVYSVLMLASMAISSGGWANRNARSSKPYTNEPRVYPATRFALGGRVAAQWSRKLVPESKSSGWLLPDDLPQQLLLEFGVGMVGYIYSLAIEVPAALLVDTVLLPLDLRRITAYRAGEETFAEALFGDDWPVSEETLQAHYRWKNCDPLIQRLLENQEIPHRREKILGLIGAGVGLEYIAAVQDLDPDMASRIMAHISVEHPPHCGTLNGLAQNPRTPTEVMTAIAGAGPYECSPSPMEGLISNPSVSPEVLEALADAESEPSILEGVARNPATSPATLDGIAQRNIERVNRVIAANPSARLETLVAMAARSPNDPELDQALAANPGTSPELLHHIVERVFHPLMGKWILRDVSLHPATTNETLLLVLETCEELDRHPAAHDARDVIDEARKNALERIGRKREAP
jgi:hypothetical protein